MALADSGTPRIVKLPKPIRWSTISGWHIGPRAGDGLRVRPSEKHWGGNWGYPGAQGRGNLSKDEQFAMRKHGEISAGVRKSEAVAPGDPIMPVSDSFGRGFVGVDGSQL